MRRSLRHVRVAAASLVAVFSLLSACAGSPPPPGSDPLQGASTRSTLPSNVGPADCDPPSTTREVDLGLEAEAATLQGEIWALFASRAPLRAGQELIVWWHIPGTSALQIVLVGAGDREVLIEDARPDPTLEWDRPGDQWVSTIAFPQPGCWRISATRGETHGDIWVRVA